MAYVWPGSVLPKTPCGMGTGQGAAAGGWVWEPTGRLQLRLGTEGREKRGPAKQGTPFVRRTDGHATVGPCGCGKSGERPHS